MHPAQWSVLIYLKAIIMSGNFLVISQIQQSLSTEVAKWKKKIE